VGATDYPGYAYFRLELEGWAIQVSSSTARARRRFDDLSPFYIVHFDHTLEFLRSAPTHVEVLRLYPFHHLGRFQYLHQMLIELFDDGPRYACRADDPNQRSLPASANPGTPDSAMVGTSGAY